jgi:superfamily II DNA or RNA helicase
MEEQLSIFKSLFKGRTDVFAIRWEKEGKAGYMPAYAIDWQQYSLHKAEGGSFKNYPNKKILPITDDRLLNHLSGKETIGVYPLLEDNSSWFIAADFDQGSTKKKNWMDDCRAFIDACHKYELPVYLERSRSGDGGHVWLFFEEPVSAGKSRKLFLTLLTRTGLVSAADKNSNFDRLFPNQDFHSGKALGNLIALPLQGKALENNNSCFVDPATGEAFADQLAFLGTIKKLSSAGFENIYADIHAEQISSLPEEEQEEESFGDQLVITLNNQLTLRRNGLNSVLLKYLRDNLNFLNNSYLLKKKAGRNVHDIEGYFRCLEEGENTVSLPRGFTGRLLRFCIEKNITYTLTDKRPSHEEMSFRDMSILRDYQKDAVEATDKKDFGIIAAPPGAGKTIIALSVIARKQQTALIIVHRKQLFDQWIERIQSFLGIPKFRIGKIAGGKCECDDMITVAMIQSLQTADLPENFYDLFGTVIIDECHHIPAKTFRDFVQHFNSRYLYGFTATPFRKDDDEKLIFIYLGDIIHQVKIPVTEEYSNRPFSVVIRDTSFFAPFDSVTDHFEVLMSILIHDTTRNELIVTDILKETTAGRKVLVLTERKTHVAILYHYLKAHVEAIAITGEDADQLKKRRLQQIKDGNFQVLVTTGQLIGEGTDIGELNCLVLAYPFSFEGKLIQYIGRVQRSSMNPVIYDYRDPRVKYLETLFKKRNTYYRRLTKSGEIKPSEELILVFEVDKFYILPAGNAFSIQYLELPMPVEKFLPGICWKIRVQEYDHGDGILTCEVIDYTCEAPAAVGTSLFYGRGIEKIKFSSICTASFLNTVILKKQSE